MNEGKGHLDGWSWEVCEIKLRKHDSFGKPYTAMITFKVVGGKMFAEGLLSVEDEELHKGDFVTIKQIAKIFGYDNISYIRIHNDHVTNKES